MKVLVTGGAGLIGYHTATYYKNKGYDVDVMDNLERSDLLGHEVSYERSHYNLNKLKDQGIKVYQNDVSKENDWAVFTGHDVIVHLAGQCGVPTSIENPRRDMEVNLLGTFNALEYAKKHQATVVFSSTNKVYPIHDLFLKHNDKWQFVNSMWQKYGFPVEPGLIGSRTPYGWSKYSADNLCQEYYHTYGVRTGIFRMSCIYGTHQFGFAEQGWCTWFAIATVKDEPITIYGDGCQVRDMLYVEDCVKAYDAFVESDIRHGVFNLGGGVKNTLSLNECIDTLYKITDKKSPVSYEDWRPCDQRTYTSDIRPLKNVLSWEPEIEPQEGLKKIVQWVEENKDIF